MNDDKRDRRRDENDPRFEYISSYTLTSLRLKHEKWHKMITTEDLKLIVLDWLNNAQRRILILNVNTAGILIPMLSFPTIARGKSAYFVKRRLIAVTSDNFRKEVLFGDLPSHIVKGLAVLVDEVFLPLLSCPFNRKLWPEIVSQDVEVQMKDIRHILAEVKGNISNKTVLPVTMQPQLILEVSDKVEGGDFSLCDVNFKNALEGMVINWTTKIFTVLQETPDNSGNYLPVNEVSYWKTRTTNLHNIYNQMRSPCIKAVANILTKINSVYATAFNSIFKSLVIALHEAQDISLWISPILKRTCAFGEINFINSKDLVKPLVHVIHLIWTNSRYYCTNKKVVGLFKAVSNLLMLRASEDLDLPTLFQGEPDEGLAKILKTLEVIEFFKIQVDDYRERGAAEGTSGFHPSPWSFQPEEVFEKLDKFLNQLHDLKEIFEAAMCFQTLERMEIGGIRGKFLTDQIKQVYKEFKTLFQKWTSSNIDLLNNNNIKASEFAEERAKFFKDSEIIERKLGTILVKAFDDCSNSEQFVKLLQMSAHLIRRPVIEPDLKNILPTLFHLYELDLRQTEDCFNAVLDQFMEHGLEAIPIDKNFPLISGAVMWIKKLRGRASKVLEENLFIDYHFLSDEQKVNLINRKEKIILKLDTLKDTIWSSWVNEINNTLQDALEASVISREGGSDFVEINLSEDLYTALREAKCLTAMEIQDIPKSVLDLYEIRDELWARRIKLTQIGEWYNSIRSETRECELILIEDEMSKLDNLLDKACQDITWRAYDNDLILKIFTMTKDIYERILEIHANINLIIEKIHCWSREPLYQRNRMGKKLLDIDNKEQAFHQRVLQCLDSKRLINDLMLKNFRLFFNYTNVEEESKNCEGNDICPGHDDKKYFEGTEEEQPFKEFPMEQVKKFEAYRKFIDDLIAAEIKESVKIRHRETRSTEQLFSHSSLEYLKMELKSSSEQHSPLFEVKLRLEGNNIKFLPEFDTNSDDNFVKRIQNLLRDIIKSSEYIPRIYQTTKGDMCDSFNLNMSYADAVRGNVEIQQLQEFIMEVVKEATHSAIEYSAIYEQFEYLWMHDMDEQLDKFLKSSEQNCSHISHRDQHNKRPLCIEKFKEQIDQYQDLHEDIEKFDTYRVFHGWLAVDVNPLKQAVLNHVCKWANLYKQYLVKHVVGSLQELQSFIDNGMKVLELNVTRENFSALLKVMTIMLQIKDREGDADSMFKPLKDVICLLKSYNVEFNKSIHRQIEELPSKWLAFKSLAAKKSHVLAPIQEYQRGIVTSRIILLNCRLNNYRDKFVKMPFFSVPCENVYSLCDTAIAHLNQMRRKFNQLSEYSRLFGIPSPDDSNLRLCYKEIRQIKQLWDFVQVIESCIIDWKSTSWIKIDADDMENECRKFTRELRTLDKNIRTWDPYIHLEGILKDLVSSLRAITELQNPAITERHWVELMHATKICFKTDVKTTLDDLLSLNLHLHEEEVKNCVDRAVKEMSVTKTLTDIKNIWNSIEFEYESHEHRQVQLLKVSEELVETLDENQMQLQNIATSKYIEYLLPKINKWQQILSSIDQLISLWFEVQRKWIYLESIFIGSADIRSQLPEDSRRFEVIDQEFAQLLDIVSSSKRVIKVIEKPEIYGKLEEILKELSVCEKALNNYLETKRVAFPRFYFISSADLLDILSNGNQPKLIDRHFIKLFDSILKLQYEESTKRATGMYSKENDEYVEFAEPFECSGKVEVWLSGIIDSMRETLRQLFKAAGQAYEYKPREHWLFDWPAQTALCCSQICWTSEVDRAFAWQEEGYENALRDYQKKQISQLNALINLLLGELSPGDRQKIMTICTIDVHCRDVVSKIIQLRVEHSTAFQWQSQLRHRWDKKLDDCFANICDAEFRYAYEYLGNTTRLVITPLTDRCYITLTQSLHLVMGGAPAGPAGTGKTETTKDLGRALGVMVYVFNCSEQMDYKSCGNIYKGLAQTGAWGCFDEFNRICVEVLSVVAVQVKTIQDAIKMKKTNFVFMGETIPLVPSVGIFITMNPGYAGRTELPENLKTLFRPCAMIVPDFALICEIMLVAEGFQEARLLARKFITLYTLCRELLSKQDHYDWGLRAIKSVLVVAGTLKRDDHSRPEDQVLMRALRDFNIPKIVTEDVPIFMGLIGDLFPALDVPRKRFLRFEKTIRRAASTIRLQTEEGFVMKVVQLQELLHVRHSVFIVGNAGTGKTKIWQTLLATYKMLKQSPIYNVLNPKALTNDELFGVVNSTTREWKDGLFSSIMRNQANMISKASKWIILDGDIDPMWIESLNTLMDDNKVLTLASNERIALQREMRLIFEVGHLKAATPATVSRAGILYINPQDLGWYPVISSWVETREDIVQRGILTRLFEKYFPLLVEHHKRFCKIIPITDIALIRTTCYLLECILNNVEMSPENLEKPLETVFVFTAIWGFGSGLFHDHTVDWRREFHKWWICEFKDVKFPASGTIFDYCLDMSSMTFQLWTELVPEFEMDAEMPLQSVLVPTSETTRLTFFLKLLMARHHPVMLVGGSGYGKGAIFRETFNSYQDNSIVQPTHLNFYTTSEMFQKILDKPLERKSGRCYGPPGNKHLIYYVSDLNMPEVDSYGTVQPHTIIRQFMDYQQWYDREKLILKEIKNCQFTASMNPTAGSFSIDPRLQRHFCILAVNYPGEDILNQIYSSILSHHLENTFNSFYKETKAIGDLLVTVGVALHRRVECAFLPTAVKFHYVFNLRDMTNIFQGMMNANKKSCGNPVDLIKLYVHEATRVYHDKLVDQHDIKSFKAMVKDVFKKEIEDFDEDYVFSEPLIYSHFAQSLLDLSYMPIKSWSDLYDLLMEAQQNYNEVVGYMNLVMFEDAMVHVCRINRILESPRGNALLIGVGGSGKQTLARLAAFISSLNVFQIQLKRGYCLQDMKDELGGLYMKVGLKNVASVFLISDAQIPEEPILMLVNDMLSSGEIPELFSEDQLEIITNGVKNEVKQSGTLDTKDNCWRYFIQKVRRLLKVVLCFSPVGNTLRIRARKFPAIISRTSIDWFHEWPKSAMESVSKKFLLDIPVLQEDLINPIGCFMAYVHCTVNQISRIYLQNEKRYNYTTPKTFLEYISLYSKLLMDKTGGHSSRIDRLESGMSKLEQCARQVDMLQEQLTTQEVELSAKNQAADKLIVMVSAENEKVKKEKFAASEEEKRVRIIEEDVSIKTRMCEQDLRKAEPALVAAHAALNTLNKNNLTELKSFGSPPKAVVNVCTAVMVLLAHNGKIPKDRSWKAAKLMMVKVDQFLNDLVNYDKDNIHPNVIEALQDYLKDPEFNPDKIVQKSVAAAGLCAWVINLHRYHEVFLIVGPKQQALQDSQEELQEARERLEYLKKKISNLEQKLFRIQSEFEQALAEKQRCQQEADKTAFTIDLAHRLVNGLANENVRWRESVSSLKEKIDTLPGDILLISSFLSYVGCFTRRYRQELQEKMWMPTFKKIEPAIPHTEGIDSLSLISDDAQIAIWNNEGLPMDRMSTENATILTNSTRWPLMIDPQLQGIKWIKNKFGAKLITIRLSQKGYLDVIERAMAAGDTVLIEQIGETLDAVLEPLLSRAVIKKGRYIKIGDIEMDLNPNFRLILHTKLANPHYKPEMQAQTTLINFTVTRDGLEEQLLAEVVKVERPDLEEMKTQLTIQQNKFKISLKMLEDELLARLASAGKNVLEETALILNLEQTKKTVDEIEAKVTEAKVTTMQIDEIRDHYRAAAKRASILYFVLNDMHKINPIYKFSLKSFMTVFLRAVNLAPQHVHLEERVAALVEAITQKTFHYVSRGLFEKDKLIFASHMAMRIMIHSRQASKEEVDFLLRYPHDPNAMPPLEFISKQSWGGIRNLAMMESFYGIDKDIENYPKRWKKFLLHDVPEKLPFPGEWKHKSHLQKLCLIRSLRPDRITYAMRLFIEQTMGKVYVEMKIESFTKIFEELTSSTPVFFVLSPGISPISEVEKIGRNLKFSEEYENFHNISLGQGQEAIAEEAISQGSKIGQWVILQNVHLVVNWLPVLEKIIETTFEESHPDFRLFISAEPAPDPESHVIPQGILESSIKIVNEPPTGMAANLHKAWDNFNQDTLEMCSQEAEFKAILFSLCYFHAVVAERRKFGSQGWNKVYPFNIGDLTISANVLHNYLEGNSRVPWEDLRYLFGEIMYGGHITDDWDRRLCRTYLEELMQQDLIDGDFELCPGFVAPPNLDFESFHEYIDDNLPEESPILYGLHPNAEIGFLTAASETLLRTIFELQPRESELSSNCCASREELVKIIIEDFMDKLQDEFKIIDLLDRVDKKTPFVVVALQECERMNSLVREIKRSLKELQLGLKGELTITEDMENLDNALFYNHVPMSWEKLAYPSLMGLQTWFADLVLRVKELAAWSMDFALPSSVWIGGLFNPQSFLTAIMQESARSNDLPLDKMCLSCDVTSKNKENISAPPKEGAFINGLYLEGASWDCTTNSIVQLRPKELFSLMPVIYIKSIIQEKQEVQRVYECPLYKTRVREKTYVWTFNLKTKEKASKWILCGVALLLQT